MPKSINKNRSRKSNSSFRTSYRLYILIALLLLTGVGIIVLNNTDLLELRTRATSDYSQYIGKPRGYLTTPQELREIKRKADQGIEPYSSNVQSLLSTAGSPTSWPYGTIAGDVACTNAADSKFVYIRDGGWKTYANAMAYHFTGNEAYAADVRTRLLDLTDTSGFGGEEYSGANQCILEMSWLIPSWIQAADLLEEYGGWTDADKRQFQGWLRDQIYRKVAWASRVRNNNWGAAGSATSMMIADYLWDYKTTLTEVKPVAKSLTPAKAFAEHKTAGLQRMNTTWIGDSACAIHGIQPYGGIPDELRRGSTGCLGTYLLDEDKSHAYMATHLEGLVFQAEILYRRGDESFYTNKNSDGSGSILQAIHFVIANPTKSYDWVISKKGTLQVAQRYYKDPEIQKRLDVNNGYTKSGYMLTFGKVTHGFAPGEVLVAPPTVPPPSDDLWAPTSTSMPTPTEAPVSQIPTLFPTATQQPTVTLQPTAAPTVSNTQGAGLRGDYYDDTNFTVNKGSQIDKEINFIWNSGCSVLFVSCDGFSIRWKGLITPPASGKYTFTVKSDDGVRLWVNNKLIINKWSDQWATEYSATYKLTGLRAVPIRLDYYEDSGNATIQLMWNGPGISKQIIPSKYLYSN